MKKRIISIVITMLTFVIVVVSLAVTFAWFTKTNKVGKFDAETKNLAISYELDDKYENSSTYSISNLVFFDIDNPNELKFLNDSHTAIKLDIKNLSTDSITYTITIESEMKITSTEETVGDTTTSTITSRAYIVGFISNNRNITVEDNTTNTISTYLPENTSLDSNTYKTVGEGEINGTTESTIYLHLLGVQDIDSATNDFLFDNTGKALEYNFTITIEAVAKTNEPTEK